MITSETDLELLESYLDEALASSEVEVLHARLVVEPELAGALDELRAQRAMRQAVWRAIEPDAMTADRLTWRVQGAMAAQTKNVARGWGQWQMTRVGSVAAACLVLGFFIGWSGHSGKTIAPTPDFGNQSPVAMNSSNSGVPSSNAGLLVPVTNESGQVVAWQPFGNSNDAKAFTEDLHRARVPAGGPDVRLAADEERVKF
jgi:hypothetical protein